MEGERGRVAFDGRFEVVIVSLAVSSLPSPSIIPPIIVLSAVVPSLSLCHLVGRHPLHLPPLSQLRPPIPVSLFGLLHSFVVTSVDFPYSSSPSLQQGLLSSLHPPATLPHHAIDFSYSPLSSSEDDDDKRSKQLDEKLLLLTYTTALLGSFGAKQFLVTLSTQ
ncbi:hypothetical protein ACLOJK_020127 [Asimina triloba]